MATAALVLSIINAVVMLANIVVVGGQGRILRRLAGMPSPEDVLRDVFKRRD